MSITSHVQVPGEGEVAVFHAQDWTGPVALHWNGQTVVVPAQVLLAVGRVATTEALRAHLLSALEQFKLPSLDGGGEGVRVNGKVYPVKYREGHPFFVGNHIVRYLLNAGERGQKGDLNHIWALHEHGLFSRGEMLGFYILLGYSVVGVQELFPEAEIVVVGKGGGE